MGRSRPVGSSAFRWPLVFVLLTSLLLAWIGPATPPAAAQPAQGIPFVWGGNDFGEAGNLVAPDGRILIPAQVFGITGLTGVAAGGDHSLFLRGSDGAVFAIGANFNGQLGDGSTAARNTPAPVLGAGGAGVATIAAGEQHSLALRADGSVIAWGNNTFGQLGTGASTGPADCDGRPCSTTPVPVTGLGGVVVRAIAAGQNHSLAVGADGRVYSWGVNQNGQLGIGTSTGPETCDPAGSAVGCSTTPAPVPGLTGIVAVAAGELHSLALRDDGAVFAWGGNFGGQLGTGDNTDRDSPVQVRGLNDAGLLTGATGVAAGTNHSFAIVAGGALYAWGDRRNGQLGDGNDRGSTDTTSRPTPIQVRGPGGEGFLTGVVAVDGGNAGGFFAGHSLAVLADGTVYAWGSNTSGQLGNGTTSDSPNAVPLRVANLGGAVAVAAGGNHSLALRSDPVAALSATGLDFGRQELGTTSTSRAVTLTNTGAGPLRIESITLNGVDFAQTNDCGVFLAPGRGCTLSVTFSPLALGTRGGTLTIRDTAEGSPRTIALTGTGTPTPARFTLALSATAGGTIAATPAPASDGTYAGGTVITLTATANPGFVFTGFLLDGVDTGLANPLTLTLAANRTARATFAPRPVFSDVAPNDPDYEAISQLAARGIIRGFDAETCWRLGRTAPCFGPEQTTVRAQAAALVVRAIGRDNESWPETFNDIGGVDLNLQRNIRTLAHYRVALGFGDGTFRPFLPVARVQVIALISRAYVDPEAIWQAQPDNGAGPNCTSYTSVPRGRGHCQDLATYVFYAGAVPGTSVGGAFPAYDQPATRRFFAQALVQALWYDRTP